MQQQRPRKNIKILRINDFYSYYLGIQAFQVSVSLSRTNKDNWLTTDVRHGYGRPHFVIDGVELGEDDPIDRVRIVAGRMIGQGCIERDKLINGLVAHKSLANK